MLVLNNLFTMAETEEIPVQITEEIKPTKIDKKSVEYLGTGKILNVLLYQSLNNMVGYVIVTLYMIADSIFIGQYLGEPGLAASALGISLELLLCIIVIQSLSVGSIALIGPALGQDRIKDARGYATQFFLLLIIYNLIVPCIMLPLRKIIAKGLGATTEPTYTYLESYITVMYAGGVLAYTINVGLLPLLRQENKVREAMTLQIVSSALNVIFDAIFFNLFLEELGMMSAALSTVISQIVIDIWIVFNFLGGVKSTVIKIDFQQLKFTKEYLKTTFIQFIPAVCNTIPVIVEIAVLNSQLAKYGGEKAVFYGAVYGIFSRLIQLLVQPRLGIYFAFLAIISYNLGQSKFRRIQKLILYADWVTFIALFVIDMILIGLMPYFIAMFNSDKQFVTDATPILRMAFSGLFTMGSISIASGVLQMSGKVVTATGIQVIKLILDVVLLFVFPLVIDVKWLFLVPAIVETSGFLMAQVIIWIQTYKYKRLADITEKEDEIKESTFEIEVSVTDNLAAVSEQKSLQD